MESKQNNPSPEIEYSILSIPNENDYGAGRYSIFLKPNVLLSPKVIAGIAINIPIFQISLKLDSVTQEITSLIGKSDGSDPLSFGVFLIPSDFNASIPHEISADFDRWQVTALKMDGIKLTEKDLRGLSEILPEKQFQGSPELFFDSIRRLLEDLFGDEWFINAEPKNSGHPAFKSWMLCKKLTEQKGSLKFPEDVKNLPEISRLVSDSFTLLSCSKGNVQLIKLGLFENYGNEKVRRKIVAVIQNDIGFKSLMTELSYAGWHISKGNTVTPYEEDSYPDFKIESSNFEIPIVADCKCVLRNTSDSRFSNIIKKANKQIKKLGINCLGLVVIDITEKIALSDDVSDKIPDEVLRISEVVKATIQDDNSSASGVLLLWDDYVIHGNPETETESLVGYRRRYHLVRHRNPRYPIPEGQDLDELGLTYGFTIMNWIIWDRKG